MTSTEHIVKALADLVRVFPSIRAFYEYQKATETHVVKIEPMEMLNDAAFQAYEEKITFDFIELFPWENINFINPKSYTVIHEVQHSFEGSNYVDDNLFVGIANYATFGESNYNFGLSHSTQDSLVYGLKEIAPSAVASDLESYQIAQTFQKEIVSSITMDSLAAIWQGLSAAERGFNDSKIDNAVKPNYAMAA